MAIELKNIRIWAIFKFYYPNFAGAAIQGHQVFQRLVEQGVSVNVLTTADHLSSHLSEQKIMRDGIFIRYLPVIRIFNIKSFKLLNGLNKLIRFLNSLVKDFSFNSRIARTIWSEGKTGDIIQLFSVGHFSWIVLLAARKKKIPTCIRLTLLGSDDPASIKSPLGKLKLFAFYQADIIISTSLAQLHSCQRANMRADKLVYIPNGVDTEKFLPIEDNKKKDIRIKLGLKARPRYIIFVGPTIYRKGIDILIHAFLQIAQQIEDVELLLVGPNDFSDHTRNKTTRDELVSTLKTEINNNELSSRVHWIGEVENVHEYMQAADVFCFPSRREGFGTVTPEAMAIGLPCVVALLEGITTNMILSQKEGLLIAGEQPADYADALIFLLNNSEMANKMGWSARTRALNQFSLKETVDKYRNLYLQTAEKHHA